MQKQASTSVAELQLENVIGEMQICLPSQLILRKLQNEEGCLKISFCTVFSHSCSHYLVQYL